MSYCLICTGIRDWKAAHILGVILSMAHLNLNNIKPKDPQLLVRLFFLDEAG